MQTPNARRSFALHHSLPTEKHTNMQEQDVILVNENDEELGVMKKMEAHQKGLLHRAFSVFIFDGNGNMLLQQRAAAKYHGGLLWTNACCSHPIPGERVEDAADRRLQEELGFRTPLQKVFAFTYKAAVENNLIEHEYDHVFVGEYDGTVNFSEAEVQTVRYLPLEEIQASLQRESHAYTEWFKLAFPQIRNWWEKKHETVLNN